MTENYKLAQDFLIEGQRFETKKLEIEATYKRTLMRMHFLKYDN
jgi:hypothetical protein